MLKNIQPSLAANLEELSVSAQSTQSFREFWFYFAENKGAVLGLVFFVGLVLTAFLAPILAPHSPIEQTRQFILLAPAWTENGNSLHLLGTDAIGRDILSRIIYGTRYSLFIGAFVTVIALTSGILFGMLAGFYRGWLDLAIMRLMDIILAFPSLLLALVFVAILGPSLTNAMIAIAVVLLPHFVRLTRIAVMAEHEKEYVVATKLIGASNFRLMWYTILPNCMGPLIVQASLSFSTGILDAAALGFLGMGAQPPTPEWGTMLAEAREFILSAWWIITFPGVAILLTVLAVNLIGDGLRDALDPKLKRS